MKDLDYWDRFLNTGRIEDYLAYREEVQDEPDLEKGAHVYAGIDQRHRDDTKG